VKELELEHHHMKWLKLISQDDGENVDAVVVEYLPLQPLVGHRAVVTIQLD
jgi:hypothetical protein